MKRENLIYYAVKYRGDYVRILKAINENEKAEEIMDIKALTILDDNYPLCLLELKYPPLVLFYKGNLNLLNTRMAGIIGSRKPCNYAIRATSILAESLKKEWTIVSGLAKGIDGVAHKCALDSATIGVIGCGIDYVYPKENDYLYAKMSINHLILSEYPYNEPPYASHFPFRNRIIAALSENIYVMQSSLKSGTLITVNEALTLGRNIYALPYDVFMEEGQGTNRLIEEGAGIILLDNIKDNKLHL